MPVRLKYDMDRLNFSQVEPLDFSRYNSLYIRGLLEETDVFRTISHCAAVLFLLPISTLCTEHNFRPSTCIELYPTKTSKIIIGWIRYPLLRIRVNLGNY